LFFVPDHSEVTDVIKGSFDLGAQYHFTMETQQCVCVPTEDGIDVYPSAQWMDLTQVGIAQALAIPENKYVLCISYVTYQVKVTL
jgi:xanthine dehydrogenase/oxidase